MPLWLAIIIAILILGFLIFIHELGHYLAAKKNGVKVEAFGIGFGPKLIKKKVGDTVYSLNIIPFGGYVKLYGEDATEGKVLKSKESFASKTPWQRIEILIAGVVMNLLVALILLTVGIGFGMDPIIGDVEDFQAKLETSNIIHVPNLIVRDVKEGSKAAQLGVTERAQIVSIDNQLPQEYTDLAAVLTMPLEQDHELVFRNPDSETIDVHLFAGEMISDFGLNLYSPANLLRPKVLSLNETVDYGLKVGDVILRVNNKPIFNEEDLAEASLLSVERIVVYRDSRVVELIPNDFILPISTVITGVVPNSPASKIGIPEGAIITGITERFVHSAQEATKLLRELELPILLGLIVNGEHQEFVIEERDEGRIGVYLSELIQVRPLVQDAVMVPVLGSIVPARQLQAPWHLAPFVAAKEAYRLSEITAVGFVSVVGQIFTDFKVPDEVGGPVAVTQITTQFLQYDAESLIWLVAVISLSLAVINLLPIPALDGGRILFVIVEVFRGGKKLEPKIESLIHLLGFVFLILLIIVISFKDVTRLVE